VSDELHPHRFEILAFVEGAVDETENDEIGEHIQKCAQCFKVYEEIVDALGILREGEVVAHVEDDDEAAEDFLRGAFELAEDREGAERDARAADALLLRLAQEPTDQWETIIGANPHTCTGALVRRLVDAAEPEMHRKPEHAQMLLHIAETVAYQLREPETCRARGLVWKQRANVLRLQTRYEDAIDAALVAKACYASLSDPDTPFELGQVQSQSRRLCS
jgi:hypothetical protein